MRYEVQWDYYSDLCSRYELGALRKGDKIELDDTLAGYINGDSPGVLAPVTRHASKAPKTRHVTTAPETRSVEATSAAEELAAEAGLDLAEIEGTGVDGKVTKPDVEAALDD